MYVDTEARETRCLPASELRLDDGERPKIIGYAALFNVWADIGGWFRESIRPGAFTKTIKEADIRALVNHDENYVLGRNKAGTLSLKEDSKGLAVEIDPVPTTWANDLLVSMRRGDVNQMSFGFMVNKQEVDYEKDERVLLDVTLFDVSVVTYPAYPQTSAQVRSAFANKGKPSELITVVDEWESLDAIVAKLKAHETWTDEERAAWIAFASPPVEPACKPLDDVTGAGLQTTPAAPGPMRLRSTLELLTAAAQLKVTQGAHSQ